MVKQRGFCLGAAFLFLTGWCTAQDKPAKSPLPAQKTTSDLPRVIRASVPFYPELARQTRIQGTVTLRVSTDGKLVSVIGAGSGHPLLVQAAKDNVKTWEFEPHSPTTFETTFRYRLLEAKCDANCRCESEEKESVLLRLPAEVEVSAVIPMICDPAVEIRKKK